MAMFFLVHGCSDICRGLPKLTLAQFVGKIPDDVMQQALAFQRLSVYVRGTTYSNEMKFSDEIKQTNSCSSFYFNCSRLALRKLPTLQKIFLMFS